MACTGSPLVWAIYYTRIMYKLNQLTNAQAREEMGIQLLLADDHALFRDGFSLLLKQLEPDVCVIEVGCFADALAYASSGLDIDIALLDLNMPGMEGASGVIRFREQASDVPVVVISSSEDGADIKHLLDAGAAGYIPKSSSSQVMLVALHLVLAGGVYVPVNVLRDSASPALISPRSSDGISRGGVQLTDRQLDVLCLILRGKPNKVIARELRLSEGTIKSHLASIYRALNAVNRTEAAMAAQRLGLCQD